MHAASHFIPPADLRVDFGTFASTSVEVSALSDSGRSFLASTFGAGCVGVTMPKTRGAEFIAFAKANGRVVA